MTQVSGMMPEITDNEKKDLKMQLMPTIKVPRAGRKPIGKVKFPKKKKAKTPGLMADAVEEMMSPAMASHTKFSAVPPLPGGTEERRASARKKAAK